MSQESRFRGAMLGLALGDCLGSPLEGSLRVSAKEVDTLINSSKPLKYTDDTETAIALADALSRGLAVDETAMHIASCADASRGYGRGAIETLRRIRSGQSWSEASRAVFPEGSLGNGAAMRAAPIGLRYHSDMSALAEACRATSCITHAHPIAIEGALLIAAATAMSLEGCSRNEIMDELTGLARQEKFLGKLALVRTMLGLDVAPVEIADALGNGVHADRSVPAALYARLRFGSDCVGAIRYSIMMGGDTDTIASMAGAMCGALAGESALPMMLLARVESAEKIAGLGSALFEASRKI